ncbi:MAG: hypothetical protein H7A25_10885 [Leptospiraceae bacterium]|nr:hypothetical protein [Leptospiraceae bacterium]MCP5500400.1 hypothetical protein [Leptospiraceae bacterium]
MRIKIFVFLVFASLLMSCATPPPPVKVGKELGAGAISVSLYAPLALGGGKSPSIVYFLKVNDPSKLLESTEVVASNYSANDRQYLFNAKPGKYVAVAAFYSVQAMGPSSSSSSSVGKSGTVTVSVTPGPTDYITFFSEEVAKSTLIDVEVNKITFAGNLSVDMSLKLENADALQKHISNLIKPGALESSVGMSMLKGSYNYVGSLKSISNDDNAKKAFKEAASQKELKESGWLEDLK